MNGIAAYRHIPADVLTAAHAVREFRNNVIHDHELRRLMTFDECRSRLGRFVSFLPTSWTNERQAFSK